jgi:hypothetical protein
MAFTTGTATDYRDLLDQLHDYLVLQGWTVNNFNLGATLTDTSNLYVTGPGFAGGQAPNISIRTEANSGTNAYSWRVTGHPDYDAALPFGSQLNNGLIHHFLLWPNALDYWFYVNDWRFIVDVLVPYNLSNSGVRAFCDPGNAAASYMKRETLDWDTVQNANSASNDIDNYTGRNGAIIWPYRCPAVENDQTDYEIAWGFFNRLRPLIGGEMPMWQCTIIDAETETIAGVLDGVYATGGFNRVPEQIVAVGAQDYRLFINVNRNTPKHYFAIEEA